MVIAVVWTSLSSTPGGSPGSSASASHQQSDQRTSEPRSPSPTSPQPSPLFSGAPTHRATATPTPIGTPGEFTLLELLSLLPTRPENRAGYDRSLFVHWVDADGDGCDTRREVLVAESRTTVSISPNCSLSEGSWVSVYDDLAFNDPGGLDIDHMVPLAEAWDSGARDWNPATRQAFANDIGVSWSLIAVSASSNRAKSDQDPADWLPTDAAALCSYLGDWLAVKVRWSLSVDQRERTALEGLIGSCSGTRRPAVLAAVSSATPLPAGSNSAACDPAYPTVCIPPPPPDLDCGEMSYRRFSVLAPDPHGFDGDNDGIGCEGG